MGLQRVVSEAATLRIERDRLTERLTNAEAELVKERHIVSEVRHTLCCNHCDAQLFFSSCLSACVSVPVALRIIIILLIF